jgi:hypothetical protein
MSELPKVTIGKITYYFDEHLKQIRNVDNPHDFLNLCDAEMYGIKKMMEKQQAKSK